MLYYLETVLKNNMIKLRGHVLRLYLIAHGCKAGKGLRCHTFPDFRIPPKNNIVIGNCVTIGSNIVIEVWNTGRLEIGSHVKITQNVIISVSRFIGIGNYTLLAENVSLRDSEHGVEAGMFIALQPAVVQEISIAEDVWIGAYSVVLKGSLLPRGAVIGAHSVVTRSCMLKENTIHAGCPARIIKPRPVKP
jgi:acetyltransferase-like isoleucine patch superfamily enzyme